jgi:hypothetical protein
MIPITTRQRFTNYRFPHAIVMALLALGGSVLHAAEPRFQNVTLLAAPDRVSLVFELTGEPNDVATRRVSAAVLEIDAGPVTMPARPTSFMAPPGTRFVMGVSIQPGIGTAGGRLKARITLLERARSTVRVVGRRVYVDFAADPPALSERSARVEGPALSERRTRVEAPAASSERNARVEGPAMSERSTRVEAPAVPSDQAYRAAVQTAVERFEQLAPFMQSAVASPTEPVLKAVGNTLTGIQGLLLSVDVPLDHRAGHEVLSSAVSAAVTAVSPTFTGDRAAQASKALGLLAQAKASW